MKPRLTGLIAAPYTPMKKNGAINPGMVAPYAAMLAKNGAAGAFVCGTTGESVLLSASERMEVLEAWVEAAPKSLKVIAHVGDTSINEAQLLAEHAQSAGACAVGAMPPSVFKARGLPELVEAMAAIAAAAPKLPFYYYHIPSFTGVNIDLCDFLHLAKKTIPNLAGAKFTASDFMQFRLCLEQDGLDILSGFDEMLLPALSMGATGAVGSTYNYAAPLYVRLLKAFAKKDLAAARELQSRSIALIRFISRVPDSDFHGVAKAILKIIGLDCGAPRLPIKAFPAARMRGLEKSLRALGFFDYCCKA